MGFKIYNFSSLASIPVCNTTLLYVVCWSDCQVIFSTQRFLELFGAKRTSDSNAAAQKVSISRYLVICRNQKQSHCTRALPRLQCARLLPYTLYSRHPSPAKKVTQGCNLSPLLFSLYISDLESYLETNSPGYVTLKNLRVQLLLFADDLVLLARPTNLHEQIR